MVGRQSEERGKLKHGEGKRKRRRKRERVRSGNEERAKEEGEGRRWGNFWCTREGCGVGVSGSGVLVLFILCINAPF